MTTSVNIGTFQQRQLFSKGIYGTWMMNGRGDVIASSNIPNSLTTSFSVDLGELRAGIGNPIQMLLPTNAAATASAVFPTTMLEYAHIALGGKLGFGAPIPRSVTVELAADYTFALPANAKPVIELGAQYSKPIVRIDSDAYEIEGAAGAYKVTMPTGEVGKKYCLTWFEYSPESKLFKIGTNLKGQIVRLVAIAPIYAKPLSGSYEASPEVGFRVYTYPMAQANPNYEMAISQDTAQTTTIAFTLLPYNENPDLDDPCIGSEQYFGYIQDYIYEHGGYGNVQSIYVPGGLVTVDAGDTVEIPLMMQRSNGMYGPAVDVADFDFNLNPPSLGTVDVSGQVAKITGNAAGTGILNIKRKSSPVTATVDISYLETNAGVEIT